MKIIDIKSIDPNVFCVNPWYHLRINNSGGLGYCIRSTDNWAEYKGPLFEEFNSNKFLTDTRQSFLENKFAPTCNRCLPEEKTHGGPFRKSQNIRAAIHHNEFFHQSLEQSPVLPRLTSNNIWPHILFVSFGNLCDLKCRMCHWTASDKLASLYQQHNYLPNFTPLNAGNPNIPMEMNWTSDSKRWQEFLDFIIQNPDLKFIIFNGGEPFINERFHQTINHLLTHNKSNIHLTITSNGTNVTDSLINKLKQFESCFIDVSLECFHPLNDYVRVGGNYHDIVKNLEFMLSYKTQKFMLGIHQTPIAYTAEHLDTVIDYCIEHDLELISNVVHPQRFLQPCVLPDDVKSNLVEKYQDKYQTVTHPTAKFTVKKIIGWLQSKPEDLEDLRKQFVQHTKDHDRMLGTDFTTALPHLVNYYKQYGL